MQNMHRRIVYMGSPDFAVVPLKAVVAAGHQVVAVFTQPDKPAGRGRLLTPPPVKVAAEHLNLPVVQPLTLRDPAVQEHIKTLAPEVIIVAAYAQLLPGSLLALPPYGCLNIHASLLPVYRGGAPIHWAIVNGENETGVTIMQMAKGLDSGDIILQESIKIGDDDTTGEVTANLADLGAKLMLQVLERLDLGAKLRQPQDHAQATYARNVKKEDGLIDWQLDAPKIHNLVRGLNPWPLAYTSFAGQYLRVLRSRLVSDLLLLEPGETRASNGRLLVGTGNGVIELLALQLSGKKVMTGSEFVHGYLRGGIVWLR